MGELRCLGKRMSVATAVAAAVVSICMASPSEAQATHIAMAYAPNEPAQASANPLQKKITVGLSNVPLEEALSELTRRSGVALMYSRDALPMRKTVSVQGTEIGLGAAIEQALRGTGFSARLTPEGRVVVSKEVARLVVEGVISGRVIDAKTKRPIAGASIVVGDGPTGVVTNSDGRFQIPASAGEHVVSIRALGYVRVTRHVTVEGSGQVTIEVVLEASASVLNEVVVTGTVVATERKALTTPITVFTAEDIQKRGITRIDQLFRGEVPGLVALDVGSRGYRATGGSDGSLDDEPGAMVTSRVYSRGSSSLDGAPNPIKTYIDGVELLDPAYLGTIDPHSIERIEIITGPQAATIYGSGAIGGVMQIFTKKGQGGTSRDLAIMLKYGVMQSNISSSFTPIHQQSLNLTGSAGSGFSYSASTSHNYTGQWQPYLFSRVFGGSVGATYQEGIATVSGAMSVSATNNGTYGRRNVDDGMGLTGLSLAQNGESRVRARRITGRKAQSSSQSASLNMDVRQTGYLQHHLTLGRTGNLFQMEPEAPMFEQAADTLYWGARSEGRRTTVAYNTSALMPRLGVISANLTVGANGSWGDEVRIRACTPDYASTAYVPCVSHVVDWIIYNVDVQKTVETESYGGFGSVRVGAFDAVYVTMGLRGERNPSYGRLHKIDWTPTVGASYTVELSPVTVKLLTSYGRATRPPAPWQRLASFGYSATYEPSSYISTFESPDLRPERSQGIQSGMEIYAGTRGTLAINHYRQTVTDLIQSVTVDSVLRTSLSSGNQIWTLQYQNVNAAKIRQSGWETTGSLVLSAFSVKGTYSWNDSRVLSVSPRAMWSVQAGHRFIGVPTHSGNLTVSYARGGTAVTLVNNYVGAIVRSTGGANNQTWPQLNTRIQTYMDRFNSLIGQWVHPGYVKSDLTATHRLTPTISTLATITNLGNRYAADVNKYDPALGRQTLIGLTWRH